MQTDKSLKLYRYISFQRFCELLFHQELVFVHPDMWPDQYETFIMRKLVLEDNNQGEIRIINKKLMTAKQVRMLKEIVETLVDDMRFLCFSRSKDSEVMWNAYSNHNEAIMIRTSLQKVLSIAPDELSPIRVHYDQKSNDLNFLFEACNIDGSFMCVHDIEGLFQHKRKCFQYENELRICASAFDTARGKSEGKLLKYPIKNLPDFIEKVMVHPLASDEYVSLVKKICKHFGISFWGRSKVYEFKA